jgi:nitroimidazol reductase NimA-like FMN-containing flavoprotein (pyridoxamine 5'-phosphate oxidase superfamily)
MRITLFEKNGDVCYSTSQIQKSISAKESMLLSLGWRSVGVITGRDMSGTRIKTMTTALREAINGKIK